MKYLFRLSSVVENENKLLIELGMEIGIIIFITNFFGEKNYDMFLQIGKFTLKKYTYY